MLRPSIAGGAILALALVLLLTSAPAVLAPPPPQATPMSWAVYYHDYIADGVLDQFDLLILDYDFAEDLEALADGGRTVLGYLSIGEVNVQRPHYRSVSADGILLEENVNWPGSYFVDVRDTRWRDRVLDELLPALLDKGFQGVFLDTADNAPYLEDRNPVTYKGMTQAMGELIIAIRERYPDIPIALNRGFELLPQVEDHIDMVLGESIRADYDFETGTYFRVPEREYRRYADMLTDVQERNPDIQILTLDYWDPNDTPGIARIYADQRARGFHPYVSTILLNRVIQEPQLEESD